MGHGGDKQFISVGGRDSDRHVLPNLALTLSQNFLSLVWMGRDSVSRHLQIH